MDSCPSPSPGPAPTRVSDVASTEDGRWRIARHAAKIGLVLALALAACSPRDVSPPPTPLPANAASPLSAPSCGPTPAPGVFPSDFPPVPLPPDAQLVAPAGAARPGGQRIDLLSPRSVRSNLRFFEAALRGRKDEFTLVFREYETIDAELTYAYGRTFVLIKIVAACEGSAVSVEAVR